MGPGHHVLLGAAGRVLQSLLRAGGTARAGFGGPGPALPCSSWLSAGAGGQQCRGQRRVRAGLSVQPRLGWDVHTRFEVFVSWCCGPGSPPASLASADKVRNDQAKMTQPCSQDAG